MAVTRVLVVGDEKRTRWSLRGHLAAGGHEVAEARTAAEAIDLVSGGADLVLLDQALPDADVAGALQRLHAVDPDVPAIVLTSPNDDRSAGDARGAGAFDHLATSADQAEVSLCVNRALEVGRLRRAHRVLRDAAARPYTPAAMIGESDIMARLRQLVRKIASSPDATVLVAGEPGTGKTLAAGVIHYLSARAPRPFLAVSCASAHERLERELFGRGPGEVGEGSRRERGLLEEADGGTLLLADIGELSPSLQARLLSVLEDKAFHRAGSVGAVSADVRILAATSRGLEAEVRDGRFRDDLFYRLNVLRVELPPLRARGDDVVLLARHFADTLGAEFNRPARAISPATEPLLRAQRWPGNVRELRNLVERATLLSRHEVLEPHDFEVLHADRPSSAGTLRGFELPPEGVNLNEVEKSLVRQALARSGGVQTRAAALLGLHRDQIRYRIEKFGLKRTDGD